MDPLDLVFVKPTTVDRYRESWLASEISAYAGWLQAQEYRPSSIKTRLPIILALGDYARDRGAAVIDDLPAFVDDFVAVRVAHRDRLTGSNREMAKEVRGPVEQFLSMTLDEFEPSARRKYPEPFVGVVPGFFPYLVVERGLRPATVCLYRYHLDILEAYLRRVGASLQEVSPALLSAFIIDRAGSGLARTTVRDAASVLRVLLRYARREGVLAADLSEAVGWPQVYRLADVPRSITWQEVNRVLESVDRRTTAGRRDYAILLLLVIYGMRAREVTALKLDDIDWKAERLRVPERKAGHSTAFPLSTLVGAALLDYLRNGRPATDERRVFFRAVAPIRPIGDAAVAGIARRYILKAGVAVPRPGSHTLRHTAVQRLVDANFDLKTIGDFVGHRTPRSTEVYAKVAVEALREVALGDAEHILGGEGSL